MTLPFLIAPRWKKQRMRDECHAERAGTGSGRVPPRLALWSEVGARLLVLAVLVWLLAAFVSRATLVVVTVLVALLLAGLLQPVVERLARLLPRWVATLVAVLALVALLGGVLVFVGERIVSEVSDLQQQLRQAAADLSNALGIQVALPDALRGGGGSAGEGGGSQSAEAGGGAPASLATTAFELLVAGFVTVALAFLFLKDGARMWGWVLARCAARVRGAVDASGRAAWTTVGTYVRRLSMVAAFDAAGIGLGLLLLGVPLVLTLAVLQFLGSYIPTIGAVVAGAAAVLVAYVSNGLVTAVLALVLIVVVQQLGNSVLEPWLMGRGLALHPAVVLVAVLAGGVLWGIAGALLFVPLVAAATAAARAWPGPGTDARAL